MARTCQIVSAPVAQPDDAGIVEVVLAGEDLDRGGQLIEVGGRAEATDQLWHILHGVGP